jgi:hypothetical protein
MKSLYEECLNLGPDMDSDDVVYVFAESVLYLIGATGAFDFQRHIKHLCKSKSAKSFRLVLREHRYSNLDLKLYVLHMAKYGSHRITQMSARYGIIWRDAKLAHLLMTENTWFRRLAIAQAKTCVYGAESLSYEAIHDMFDNIYPRVLGYIKHITYSKLRFLVKSTNSTYQDFHSELSIKLVQSFYALVPVQIPEAHLVNYLKRSIHNHAINMIKSGTTQKRGRMVSEMDKSGVRNFSMLCMSQNQMALTSTGELQDVDGVDDSAAIFEARFSIVEVLKQLREGSPKYKFLSIMLGHEDKLFSQWLRDSGNCAKHEDNLDVQHSTDPEAYTALVRTYLKATQENIDTFFESLKLQMAW